MREFQNSLHLLRHKKQEGGGGGVGRYYLVMGYCYRIFLQRGWRGEYNTQFALKTREEFHTKLGQKNEWGGGGLTFICRKLTHSTPAERHFFKFIH